MPKKKSLKSNNKRQSLMKSRIEDTKLPAIEASVLPIEPSRAPSCSLPPLIPLPDDNAYVSNHNAATTTTSTTSSTNTVTNSNTHATRPTTTTSNNTTTTNTNTNRKRSAVDANLTLDESLTEYDLELKAFECPRCELRFESTVLLFDHMRVAHEDPTVCHVCHKDLKAMPNILSHSYLEKGIKPYKCPKPGCDYSCRTRFNIKTHLASCAGIQKFRYHRPSKRPKTSGNNSGAATKKNSRKNDDDDITFVQSGSVYRTGNVYDYSRENLFNVKSAKTAKNSIMQELKDSGMADANRDTQYLVIIHADYVPSKLGTFSF
eukprot:CAMPEP_0202685774 /NCGR_PEP_ID=MMETSP1385-20130828/1611_1 /ASSEMBLY_ACC=CAM_ASM_000861 /TAXON_ID=933848 /ORGANISM="Elphidium margaritaceum" /LENGTH=318 /DNA_ID=CAMNT_0049340209 /DNA_START=68 /DNA_END=1024 /DNA_ORIENTATION=+